MMTTNTKKHHREYEHKALTVEDSLHLECQQEDNDFHRRVLMRRMDKLKGRLNI